MNWRFTLIDYTSNSAGVSYVLSEEPRGWAEFEITAKRDLDVHGIFFEESTGVLGFGKSSGYEVVSTAFGLKAAEAKTELLVEIDCGSGYEEAYRGSLIYAKFKYYFGDYCEATCPIEQIGCLQTFRNRYSQRVDVQALATIDGTPLQTYQALPEEITLYAKPIYFITELNEAHDYSFTSGQMATGQTYNLLSAFEYDIIREDIVTTNAITGELFTTDLIPAPAFREQVAGILTFTGEGIQCYGFLDVAIRLKGTLIETSVETRIYNATFRFVHVDSAGTIKNQATISGELGGSFGGLSTNTAPFDITYNPTVSVVPGDRIYVYLQVLNYQASTGVVGVSAGFDLDVTFEIGNFTGTFTSLCNDSLCNIFLVHETLSRISEIITDDCLKVYSEYFGRIDSEPYSYDADGCAGLTGLTNGLFIRRALRTDASPVKFFASFREIFEGLKAIHNTGMSLEQLAGYSGDNVIRIEPFSYYYQNTILLTFSGPKEVRVEVDPSRVFSLINIGYSKWEVEAGAGLDEIQTKREYKTELVSTDTKLDAISNLIASTYAWEITRRQGQTTTDYKYDNDLFILCLDRIYGGYAPEVWNYFAANILSQIQLHNLRITPVRNLLRWFSTIAAGWSRQFATTTLGLLFSSGEGNYIAETEKVEDEACLLETQPGGIVPPVLADRLAENENIDKNRFKTIPYPVWQPYVANIKYPLSFAQFIQIKANPYSLIKFTQGRANYIGWILELKYKPTEGIADFRLLIRYDSANPSRAFG